MSFTQLTSPMPVFVIGKGKGNAFAVIDYGPEHNLIWVTAIDDSGEIWCAPNTKVRMRPNWTGGRGASRAEREAGSGEIGRNEPSPRRLRAIDGDETETETAVTA